jgi:hypothetical protein
VANAAILAGLGWAAGDAVLSRLATPSVVGLGLAWLVFLGLHTWYGHRGWPSWSKWGVLCAFGLASLVWYVLGALHFLQLPIGTWGEDRFIKRLSQWGAPLIFWAFAALYSRPVLSARLMPPTRNPETEGPV